MRHQRTYRITASIIIDDMVKSGYYTVYDNWVFDETNEGIEIFKTLEDAEARLKDIIKIPSKCIRRYMIINDKNFIVYHCDRKRN